MLTPQFLLPIHGELVVDLFAGGGGASTGIEQAIGRPVDVAINHDREAVALHQANHPQTLHLVSDVFEVDPLAVTHGRPVGGTSGYAGEFGQNRPGIAASVDRRAEGGVLEDEVKLARFVSFVNAPDEADPTVAFDESGQRKVPVLMGMPSIPVG